MNLYTGGSLMMRAPGRNYPLVNAQLPSLRAGCGGIDIYGGAFSFINKQQFIALLQNIGSNAVGYAFKLALQSISPDIDKLLTELQDQMNKINAMNINSCEAAQALVNGVVGEYDNSVQSGCANISQYLGSVSDRAEARLTCATNAPRWSRRRQLRRPERAQRHLRQGQRHLARAEPGGRQHQPAGEGADHERDRHRHPLRRRPTTAAAPAALRRAHHHRPARPAARSRRLGHGRQRRYRGLRLRRTRRVPEPGAHHRLGQALHAPGVRAAAPHVRQHRHAQPADAADIGFINNTSEPVYKMLAVANAVPGSGTAETLIETYKDVIALDYAETFLSRSPSPRP
jgi:conjugative transfer pilus assembly protein TraH